MKCRKCQTELPDEAKFCLECGASLRVASPGLESQSEPTIRRLIPEPERKHVTALFSDLTGYTAMTERLDPEQIHHNVAACFRILKDENRFQRVAH